MIKKTTNDPMEDAPEANAPPSNKKTKSARKIIKTAATKKTTAKRRKKRLTYTSRANIVALSIRLYSDQKEVISELASATNRSLNGVLLVIVHEFLKDLDEERARHTGVDEAGNRIPGPEEAEFLLGKNYLNRDEAAYKQAPFQFRDEKSVIDRFKVLMDELDYPSVNVIFQVMVDRYLAKHNLPQSLS